MRAIIIAGVGIIAALQLCTAPPAVLGPIILGTVGGELGATTSLAIQGKIPHKRDGIQPEQQQDEML